MNAASDGTGEPEPPSMDEILARAEKAIARLQGAFEAGTEQRLQRMGEIMELRWVPRATRDDAVREFRRLNHDIKGEAGSFGYDLLGEIADRFSDYLRETPIPAQEEGAVRRHVDALRLAWRQRLRGDGGEDGRRLLEGLGRQ